MEKNKVLHRFDLLILILSIYVLGALMVDTFFKIDKDVSELLMMIDNGICVVFMIDFFWRLVLAPSKLQFLKWGWIDLVSSIPALEILRYGRLFRIIRLLRVLRAFRSTKVLVSFMYKNKSQGLFVTVSTIAILMIIFSSIAILQVETVPESNIKTPGDALWWAFVTVTTVGYGDKYPVTSEGRIIAAFLMTAGVGLFGTFTGFVASWFVEGNKEEESLPEKQSG